MAAEAEAAREAKAKVWFCCDSFDCKACKIVVKWQAATVLQLPPTFPFTGNAVLTLTLQTSLILLTVLTSNVHRVAGDSHNTVNVDWMIQFSQQTHGIVIELRVNTLL